MVAPEGAVDDGTLRPWALFYGVAGGYFEATGIRLLRGRFIDRGDVERWRTGCLIAGPLVHPLLAGARERSRPAGRQSISQVCAPIRDRAEGATHRL